MTDKLTEELIQQINKDDNQLSSLLKFADIRYILSIEDLKIPGEDYSKTISPVGLIIRLQHLDGMFALLKPLAKYYPGFIDKYENLKDELQKYDRNKGDRFIYLETLNKMYIELCELKARVIYRINIDVPIFTTETSLEEEQEAERIVKKFNDDRLSARNKE